MSNSYETVRLEKRGHVAEVVLNRPERGNAMNPLFFREFGRAMAEVETDPEVRVALVYGEGKAFSYGLDLTEAISELEPLLKGDTAAPRVRLRRYIQELQEQIGMPASIATPVVAAVHGWCIGGGLDLAAACDIRFATRDARFSLREARVGIVADLGSLQRLPRIVGDAATRELALTAKDIDAERALRLGLISELLDDRDALLARARAEAELIASLSPLVVQGVKQVLNYQEGKSAEAGLEYVATWNAAYLASADLIEAMAAHFEKRRPGYKGE